MNPFIKLDNRSVLLSVIEHNRESRARYLAPLHKSGLEVQCLCRSEGLPMGIGRRSVPYETFYLYHLHRTDPGRHAIGCPHRMPGLPKKRMGALPLVEVKDGFINLNLGAPLFTMAPRADVNPPRAGSASSRDGGVRPHADLLVLLELLWSEAELNLWHPGFSGRRNYCVVRERLMKKAAEVLVRGTRLQSRFYVPPAYRADLAEEIDRELRTFLDGLAERDGRRWFGFVGGLLKEVKETEQGSAVFCFGHTRLQAWANPDRWRQLKERCFGNQLPAENRVYFALARVLRHEGGRPWLSAEDLAAVRLADTRCWIPVNSVYERQLALHLVENGRRFRKPMAVEAEDGDPLPAFILEDCEDRAYLEVLDTRSEVRHARRWAEKRAVYAALGQKVWVWDPSVQPRPSPLPDAEHQARRSPERYKQPSNA